MRPSGQTWTVPSGSGAFLGIAAAEERSKCAIIFCCIPYHQQVGIMGQQGRVLTAVLWEGAKQRTDGLENRKYGCVLISVEVQTSKHGREARVTRTDPIPDGEIPLLQRLPQLPAAHRETSRLPTFEGGPPPSSQSPARQLHTPFTDSCARLVRFCHCALPSCRSLGCYLFMFAVELF